MTYHRDAERVSLDEVRKRIEETDLVPSRVSLLDGIDRVRGGMELREKS